MLDVFVVLVVGQAWITSMALPMYPFSSNRESHIPHVSCDNVKIYADEYVPCPLCRC